MDLLEPEAAVEFLLTRSGRSDREGAKRLAAALENLPLALDHAGAYVRLTGMSFDRYGERLQDLIAKAPRGAAYPESVPAHRARPRSRCSPSSHSSGQIAFRSIS